MKWDKILFIAILILIEIMVFYLLLGGLGLLPKWFYQQCDNINVDTAKLRGCCEDRDMTRPISWIFGEDNCNKYRDNNSIEVKK